jgi:hypothetical protein
MEIKFSILNKLCRYLNLQGVLEYYIGSSLAIKSTVYLNQMLNFLWMKLPHFYGQIIKFRSTNNQNILKSFLNIYF